MKTRTIDLCFDGMIVIMAILFLQGCKCPPQVASSDTVVRTITKIEKRDSAVYLTDSAGLYALIYCDSVGEARIRQIKDYYAGQFIKPKIIIKDNWLKVDCKIDSAKVAWSWNETHTVKQEVIHTTTVPEPVNYLTGWQWFQVWAFRIMAGFILIVLALAVLRQYTGFRLPWQK